MEIEDRTLRKRTTSRLPFLNSSVDVANRLGPIASPAPPRRGGDLVTPLSDRACDGCLSRDHRAWRTWVSRPDIRATRCGRRDTRRRNRALACRAVRYRRGSGRRRHDCCCRASAARRSRPYSPQSADNIETMAQSGVGRIFPVLVDACVFRRSTRAVSTSFDSYPGGGIVRLTALAATRYRTTCPTPDTCFAASTT